MQSDTYYNNISPQKVISLFSGAGGLDIESVVKESYLLRSTFTYNRLRSEGYLRQVDSIGT